MKPDASQMDICGVVPVIVPDTKKDDDDVGENDDVSSLIPEEFDYLQNKEMSPAGGLIMKDEALSQDEGRGPLLPPAKISKQDDENKQGAEISEEEKSHICYYCSLAFSDLEEFMDHMEIHRSAEDPTTDVCDNKCEQHDVEQHLEAHDNRSVANKDPQSPVPGIKAEICEYDKQVTHTTILNTPPKKFASDLTDCCKTFDDNEKLQNHSVIQGLHN